MNLKVVSDLELLEQEILDNFCYYYQCDLVTEIKDSSNADIKEKILSRMQKNDFQISENLSSQMEMLGMVITIPFSPAQTFELLSQIKLLGQEMEDLPLRLYKKRFSEILMAYVDMLGSLDLIQKSTIKRKAKAMCAVKARYEKNLYPRREILYRVLREQLVLRGRKWDKLNQAVTSIIPMLLKEYEKYDIDWVKSQIKQNQNELEKLEQKHSQILKEIPTDDGIKRKKLSLTSKAKKVKNLQDELKKLNTILKSKHPSVALRDLGYRMPYNNTDYMDETIIHELRNQPELLQEILF